MSDVSDTPLPAPDSDQAFNVLKLYVSGNTPRSTRSIRNLRLVCDRYLRERYSLEVIDIYHNPAAAREAQIIAVPTLIKLSPAPRRVLIGDLADSVKLRQALDVFEEGEA